MLAVENLPANAGDLRNMGSIHGLGRSPGEGSGNPLQYSCLQNPTGRGVRQATVHRVTKSWTWLKPLSMPHAQIQYVPTEGLSPVAQLYFSSNFLCLWIQHLSINTLKFMSGKKNVTLVKQPNNFISVSSPHLLFHHTENQVSSIVWRYLHTLCLGMDL